MRLTTAIAMKDRPACFGTPPERDHPRLIQLGISIMRGYAVPPYNYVRHRTVTPESLAGETKSSLS
jgi:hypothetical protein